MATQKFFFFQYACILADNFVRLRLKMAKYGCKKKINLNMTTLTWS